MPQSMTKFWNFRNVSNSETELLLYGYIADESWWDDEVSPRMFLDDLAAAGDVSQITVRINSYGGSVFAGHALHSILKQHKAKVTVRIDGIAASAASVVAMAGDRIIMPSNAMMMIHNPLTIAFGDADEMRKVADTLDSVRESILAAYRDRTGHSNEKLRELMDAETWMTAAEAVELGFADEVEQSVRVAASIGGGALIINGTRFDLSRMKSIPAALFAGEEVSNMEIPTNTPAEPVVPPITAVSPVSNEPALAEPVAATNPATDPQDPATPTTTDDPVQNAILAERRRIADVQALARPGAEAVIAAAIEDGSSPADTALRILNSTQVQNMDLLAARRRDAAAINGIDPAVGGGLNDGKDAGFLAQFKASAKGLLQNRGTAAKTE